MISDTAIDVQGISKSFYVSHRKDTTVLSRMSDLLPWGAKRHNCTKVDVLVNITFSVAKGEVLGVIGRNGAGKTTLLQAIAGIRAIDEGVISTSDTVVPIIHLGVGMRNGLTVQDNIFLILSMFGKRRSDAVALYDSILDFAELNDAGQMYPSHLSSGMRQRLAFSIAVHTEPKILLLDEVFSAGDIYFTKKTGQKMKQLVGGDTTVIMVSHSLDRIAQHCDKVLWLEGGGQRMIGEPRTVITAYRDSIKTA